MSWNRVAVVKILGILELPQCEEGKGVKEADLEDGTGAGEGGVGRVDVQRGKRLEPNGAADHLTHGRQHIDSVVV